MKQIMVVEDEPDTGDLIQAVLEREGYGVTRARDGRQAVLLIETTLPPALILLDVVVPYVNGFELLVGLRHNPDWQHIPIIMVSADSYGPDIQRAMDLGATAYVVKTPGFQNLIETIHHTLGQSTDTTSPQTLTQPPRRATPGTRARRRSVARPAGIHTDRKRKAA